MIYLVYVTWANTEVNHAGMKYLCKKLEELFPDKYTAIEMLTPKFNFPGKPCLFFKIIYKVIDPVKSWIDNMKIKNHNRAFTNRLQVKDDDIIILMEYMDKEVNQHEVAKILRRRFKNIRIFGLTHLVPERLNLTFNKKDLNNWIHSIDGLITFGSSLTRYYTTRGVNPSKIITTFHYVDEYYKNNNIRDEGFKVLIQGNMMRNIELLKNIIEQTPDITFVLCQGIKDYSAQFGNYVNVKLTPFLKEEELRALMAKCPVSLNVMKDTIGSNVIVTSMAMGQAMLCSDVGSIRDYCDETNCIFCNTAQDFSKALILLKNNSKLLNEMRESSVRKSTKFSVTNFSSELLTKINNN